MDLHYGICFYAGKNKVSNIQKHYEIFQNIQQENKNFYIIFMVDSKDPDERIKFSRNTLKSLDLLKKTNIHFLHDFNWGGTIAGLHLLFQHLKNQQNSYIAFFEEDFQATNPEWFETAKKYIPDYFMIGEGNIPSIDNPDLCQIKVSDSRYMIKYKMHKTYQNEAWTDGGFYFSTTEKFQKIYDTIGIFHKGDQNTKYNHDYEKIDLGEVGFPSALFNNKLKFTGLFRYKFFKHDEGKKKKT